MRLPVDDPLHTVDRHFLGFDYNGKAHTFPWSEQTFAFYGIAGLITLLSLIAVYLAGAWNLIGGGVALIVGVVAAKYIAKRLSHDRSLMSEALVYIDESHGPRRQRVRVVRVRGLVPQPPRRLR